LRTRANEITAERLLTWGSIEENSTGWRHFEMVVKLGIQERKNHHLFQRHDVLLQPTHALKRHLEMSEKKLSSLAVIQLSTDLAVLITLPSQ
jgi:hypothetical protein